MQSNPIIPAGIHVLTEMYHLDIDNDGICCRNTSVD